MYAASPWLSGQFHPKMWKNCVIANFQYFDLIVFHKTQIDFFMRYLHHNHQWDTNIANFTFTTEHTSIIVIFQVKSLYLIFFKNHGNRGHFYSKSALKKSRNCKYPDNWGGFFFKFSQHFKKWKHHKSQVFTFFCFRPFFLLQIE